LDEFKLFLQNNAVGILALFITPALAWFFNRRKETSDIKKIDADATSVIASSSGSLAASWEKFAEKMQIEYNECKETTAHLQTSIEEYKITTESLDKKVNIITGHNNELEVKVNEVTTKNDQLQISVNTFKSENDKLKTYTQKLVGFIETLLDQIEKIDPDKANENIKELEIIKIQFKEVENNA
jgi:chromosome segregation ATPase